MSKVRFLKMKSNVWVVRKSEDTWDVYIRNSLPKEDCDSIPAESKIEDALSMLGRNMEIDVPCTMAVLVRSKLPTKEELGGVSEEIYAEWLKVLSAHQYV